MRLNKRRYYSRASKPEVRIEYPSRGATYFHEVYGVYKYDTYPMSSVLGGQQRRTFLDQFDTLEEAKAKYPDAKESGSCYVPPPVMHRPSWFDESDAGERWDDDY
jgi:hypothetical protein